VKLTNNGTENKAVAMLNKMFFKTAAHSIVELRFMEVFND